LKDKLQAFASRVACEKLGPIGEVDQALAQIQLADAEGIIRMLFTRYTVNLFKAF